MCTSALVRGSRVASRVRLLNSLQRLLLHAFKRPKLGRSLLGSCKCPLLRSHCQHFWKKDLKVVPFCGHIAGIFGRKIKKVVPFCHIASLSHCRHIWKKYQKAAPALLNGWSSSAPGVTG